MNYSHVLCVYPYKRELKTIPFFPPIGLEYIAAAAKPFVDKVTVVDMRFEDPDKHFPGKDLILISVNWGHEEKDIKEWIRTIPSTILTIVGGRYATENVEEHLNECPNIDILVRGDGEEVIQDILSVKDLQEIDGISYRQNGKIIHNPSRMLSQVSDSLYPDRTLRRYQYRVVTGGFDFGVDVDSISSSRGCPFECKYCDFGANPFGEKRTWSGRKEESVIEEIEKISAKYIIFTDDNFTFDMKRVEKICDLIIERGIKKIFIINTRLNIASNQEVLKKMHLAGFSVLMIGIESTLDRTLKSMQKGFTIKQVREWAATLNRFNFFFHGYFIIGNIDEDEFDMMKIPEFAKSIGVDTLGLSTLRALKFSPLLHLLKERPEYKIDKNGKVYSDKLSTKDIRRIRRTIAKDFYLNAYQISRILRKIITLHLIPLKSLLSLIYQGGKRLFIKGTLVVRD